MKGSIKMCIRDRNESGSWYFRGGQLQFGYSGTVQWMGLNCTISGGKLVPVGVSGAIASRAASANSDTNWLIVTDTNACRTVVFYGQNGCWTAVKNLSCTPGKNSTPTVTGDFKVTGRGKMCIRDSVCSDDDLYKSGYGYAEVYAGQ